MLEYIVIGIIIGFALILAGSVSPEGLRATLNNILQVPSTQEPVTSPPPTVTQPPTQAPIISNYAPAPTPTPTPYIY